jgi:hypothetical protein
MLAISSFMERLARSVLDGFASHARGLYALAPEENTMMNADGPIKTADLDELRLQPGPETGICEVISVGGCDELPYVFELARNQRLSFSVTASHEVDVVLCAEGAYEDWVDAGLPDDHPLEAILILRHGCIHSLDFRTEEDSMLVAIVINLGEEVIEAVVAATIRDSTGKLC